MSSINAMPYNLEAEQALLGCMLMDNAVIPEITEALQESDFYVESHQIIYRGIMTVYQSRKALDIITVTDALETQAKLADVGGIAYITELAQTVPSAANYAEYLEIVKRDGLNRSIIRAAGEIAEYARKSDSGEGSIQYAESRLYAVSDKRSGSTAEDIRETGFNDVLERMNALAMNKDAFMGVKTGFFRLDKLTNGLQKQNLIILAARPGMGKTSLAMNIIEHAALYDNKVCAVFSLEMSTLEIKWRLLCAASGVSSSAANAGRLGTEEWKRLTKYSDKLSRASISIDDNAGITPAEILSKCRRIKARNGGRLDLVMVDYIQLMSSGKRYGEQNRTQEVADVTRALKLMAKELDVPVLALSQLRRLDKNDKPQLSDLRESGAIEQDADVVMFIERPDVGLSDEEMAKKSIIKGAAILTIAKHRNGELAKLPLRFRGEITKFVDAE